MESDKMGKMGILVVDDDADFRESMKIILEGEGYSIDSASSGNEALKLLDERMYFLVLTDMVMPGLTGMELLEKIKADYLMTEVIMISGYGTIDKAVEAMKKGAFGFFVKGNDIESLISEIKKAETIRNLKNENYVLKSRINKVPYLIESKNNEFLEILSVIEKAATSNANVLIMGESGVGKEVLVEHLHKKSNRKEAPLVTVNCQAFSESLLESELFGHEKGAFTGAFNRRIGRFEEASGGTFFLDEIGELSPSTQVKLLRTIENKYIERAGSNKRIPIDLRLVCATNKNLMKEVQEKRFREDLFYRINTISVYVPPLRNRREDLPMFIDFFFEKFSSEQKKKIKSVSKDVKKFLLEYDYPGNIRELKNIIERLIVLSEDGNVTEHGLHVSTQLSEGRSGDLSLKEVRQYAEKAHILKVLDECNYNKNKAAEVLNITSRQLYNKMVEYNIK